jgi:hypothetical protein
MKQIESFKAHKKTNRFNKNQRIWIQNNFGNHCHIVYKYRNNGRWVKGIINNEWFNRKTQKFEVKDDFYNMIMEV